MNVINFSDARNRLKPVLDQVSEDADYTVIARRDADDAVVMSLHQFNSLMETVHLLKSPNNVAHLSESIGQYQAGKATQKELLEDEGVSQNKGYWLGQMLHGLIICLVGKSGRVKIRKPLNELTNSS